MREMDSTSEWLGDVTRATVQAKQKWIAILPRTTKGASMFLITEMPLEGEMDIDATNAAATASQAAPAPCPARAFRQLYCIAGHAEEHAGGPPRSLGITSVEQPNQSVGPQTVVSPQVKVTADRPLYCRG